ncbi:MAG: phage tail tape measure protein [Alphaproteobacteria bacterium]
MTQIIDGLTVKVDADTDQFTAKLKEASSLGKSFGASLSQAFEDVAFRGRSLSQAFSGLALSLAKSTLKSSVAPVGEALSGAFGSLFTGGAGGGGLGSILPFAKGGVVNQPTLMGLSAPRLGVMGEAGPEAVLPLARGTDGRLGVRSSSGGGTNITVNITTQNAESFRRAQGQVSALIARAVDRGRRNQ